VVIRQRGFTHPANTSSRNRSGAADIPGHPTSECRKSASASPSAEPQTLMLPDGFSRSCSGTGRDCDDKFGPAFDRAARVVGAKVIWTAVRAPHRTGSGAPLRKHNASRWFTRSRLGTGRGGSAKRSSTSGRVVFVGLD
jgi:hypothetical protein